jgi:Kdo2-lipid IVA lauroyltransferase/acyltransferase
MTALFYYLTYPFVYLLASLPFPALYAVSDALAWLMRLVGYRKDVIKTNLRNSFPEKSEAEIRDIYLQFYTYLCDLMLETIKTMRMTEEEYKERVIVENPELLHDLYAKGKSVVLMLGHYGNWELFGPCMSLNTDHQLVVVFRPLTNPYFDRMMTSWRTRFGTEITPVQQTLRTMINNKNRLTITAFISDQAAPIGAYWTTFLHQETSVFTGAEKVASKFGFPVVYLHGARPKRGHYTIKLEILYAEPSKTGENEISEGFTRRLERDIVADPVIWLWSHKRWKNKRPIQA